MQSYLEPTLEQIQAEIQTLPNQKNKLLLLMLNIEQYINPNCDSELFYKELKTHLLTLQSMVTDQSEADRLGILVDYFFNKINFEIIDKNGYEKLPHWELPNVLSQKSSTAFVSRMIFLFFALELDIQLQAVEHSDLCLVAWTNNNDEQFLNLFLKAKRLTQQEIILCFNQRGANSTDKNCLESLSDIDLLKKYLLQMMTFYNKFNSPKVYLKLLNIYLSIDKNHLHSLSERALLYKELGQTNKAYNDLKRYMSFTDINNTPKSIKLAYYELQAIHKERVDLLLKQEPRTFH